MKYKLLGKTGLRVSELCLGTMTFGEDWGWGASEEESHRIYDLFRQEGGNFIDTANLYTNGTSERFLGNFMGTDREAVVLATKYTNAMPGKDPNAAGNSRKNMMQAVEASLERLRTDYIDVLYLHIWDFLTPVEEVMRAFDDLVRQGKVLYPAISDTPAWLVSRAQTLAEWRGWAPLAALQIEYSLIERTPERELLPMANAMEMAVLAWSPLAGGLLTGKYAKGAAPKEGGGDGNKRFDVAMMSEMGQMDDRKHAAADAVDAVAKEIGRSSAQVAIAWLMHQPGTVIPIIGARKASQVEDNLRAVDLVISDDQLRRLAEASKIVLGFPHDFFSMEMVRGFAYGGAYDAIEKGRVRN